MTLTYLNEIIEYSERHNDAKKNWCTVGYNYNSAQCLKKYRDPHSEGHWQCHINSLDISGKTINYSPRWCRVKE